MADGENRMVFDLRGKRRNVVRVVYGILAFLMAASLLLVIGPFSISELVDSGSSDATEALEQRAESIEKQLAKRPQDEGLLLALTRARIGAGNARIGVDEQTGQPGPTTDEARDDYERGLEAWNRYLKQVEGKPNASAAQLVATTFFGQAERGSTSYRDLESNVQAAAAAQRIVATQRPSIGSLTSLAIYEYFNGDFAAGDKALDQALAEASSKAEAKSIRKQLAAYRKRAKQFAKQKKAAAKAESGRAKEAIEDPFGLGAATP